MAAWRTWRRSSKHLQGLRSGGDVQRDSPGGKSARLARDPLDEHCGDEFPVQIAVHDLGLVRAQRVEVEQRLQALEHELHPPPSIRGLIQRKKRRMKLPSWELPPC